MLRFGLGDVDGSLVDGGGIHEPVMLGAPGDLFPYGRADSRYDGGEATRARDLMFIVLASPVTEVTPAVVGSVGSVEACDVEGRGYGYPGDRPSEQTGPLPGTQKNVPLCLQAERADGLLAASSAQTSLCTGDSGGGLMQRGTNNVLGIVQGSDTACGAGLTTLFVSLEYEADFVAEAVAAAR